MSVNLFSDTINIPNIGELYIIVPKEGIVMTAYSLDTPLVYTHQVLEYIIYNVREILESTNESEENVVLIINKLVVHLNRRF